MKEILLLNGFLQVSVNFLSLCSCIFIFKLSIEVSPYYFTTFFLSSTAIVLTYLKHSKDIHTPYGEKSTAILIFQDLCNSYLFAYYILTNDTLSMVSLLKLLFQQLYNHSFMFNWKKLVFLDF